MNGARIARTTVTFGFHLLTQLTANPSLSNMAGVLFDPNWIIVGVVVAGEAYLAELKRD